MIRAHALARLLLAGPNGVVAFWHEECAQEHAVEQVVTLPSDDGPVVVVGMQIPVTAETETVWSDR